MKHENTAPSQPLILITNDDGILSPGMWAAARAVEPLGEILVIAPTEQRSGAGRSHITFSNTMNEKMVPLNGRMIKAFALDMTPAGAVFRGISTLTPRRPALLISGINYGENVGTGITGSGTVGAALEGGIWGIPSLAVSLEMEPKYYLSHSSDIDFTLAAHITARIVRRILEIGLPGGVDVLKIDIPKTATEETPMQLTRQSCKRHYYRRRENSHEGTDPTFERVLDPREAEPGSDIRTLFVERCISVCPLSIDLTASVSADVMQPFLIPPRQNSR